MGTFGFFWLQGEVCLVQDLRKNELRYGALSDVCPLGRERSEWVPYPVNFA